MGIYREGFKKVLDRFEQVNKCIVTGIYPLCRLIRLNVRRIGTYELKKSNNGLDRVTIVEFLSDRVVCQHYVGQFFIFLQGNIESPLKRDGCDW